MNTVPEQINIEDCETVPCPLCGAVNNCPVAKGRDTEYGTSSLQFKMVACASCDHCFLNPRPRISAAHLMYPSTYYTLADRHRPKGSRLIAGIKGYIVKRRLSHFNNLLSCEGTKILEVGCGDCALLIALKHAYPHLACTGIDLSVTDEQRQECQRLGITIIEQPVEDISLPDSIFDLVIMNQLIEHLWNPNRVLAKIFSTLRTGGFISIETINLDGYDRPLFFEGAWGGYYFPRHLNLFSSDSLAHILECNGYQITKKYNLLAPIVWIFSIRAVMSTTKWAPLRAMKKIVSDKSPLWLAIFSILDSVAIMLKRTTSNQKIIAKKV